MPSSSVSILIFGTDPSLLQTRRWVLERTGARVWTTLNLSEFDGVAAGEEIDLVILCHSLSTEECERALSMAYRIWTKAQTLLLTSGMAGRERGLPGQFADASRGPAQLLDAVTKLLGARHGNSIHTTNQHR